ncbi:MAG: putative DNA binding domain-containing protein [Kiritimatiellae bacterium]|nr:putative DNA binding domain-containing protein [Kiritimatiellia bacterium]
MKAKETRFGEMFEGGVKYVSPSFQRAYGWKRSRCARYLEWLSGGGEGELFLGAVVVMDLGTAPDGCRKRLLIDGTHRVMTGLAILLAARDLLGGAGEGVGKEIHERYFVHRREDGHGSFKCIVPRKDRAAFEGLVSGKGNCGENSGFARAYGYLKGELSGWGPAALEAAARRLGAGVAMVELALEADEDPYPIFKLLNAPGEEFTDRGLKEYTRFSSDPELMAMIAGGESREVEFKERTIRLGKGGCRAGGEGAFGILRSVAGFMNSSRGGTLLIGVCDDGSIRGVEDEYALVDKGKANWDGYQLFLGMRLRSRLDTQNPFRFYQIERRRVQQHDVCMVKVQPGEAPAYLDKRLYVRSGNQTIELMGPDLIDYVAARWPKKG